MNFEVPRVLPMATVDALLSAKEFYFLADNDLPTELVRGKIIPMNMPAPRHGYLGNRAGRILGNFVDEHDLGRVMNNDSGVVTEHDPDTVRGADVAYYSYARLPKGPLPEGYVDVVPELVVEILSPSDRWSIVLAKVAEYLKAGVLVVGILDPQGETMTVYRSDKPPQVLIAEDEFVVPDVLGDFRVKVGKFFA
jgi:Uma2 family endonuclease